MYIVKDSGFYDLLEQEDMVMAARGFQIHKELLLRFWGKSKEEREQKLLGFMLKGQLIESIFLILKGVIPVIMLHHIDDIVVTCAALSNLKPKLIQRKSN